MKHITLLEILDTHTRVIEEAGGSDGVRDPGALESALAQPAMTCGGDDLYTTLTEKTSALGFSLIMNHPFVDGNKRVGHAAMEVFLEKNGHRLEATVDDGDDDNH